MNKEGMKSNVFWHATIKQDIELSFPDALDTSEAATEYHLAECLNLVELINRLSEMIGVKVNWTDNLIAHESRKFIYTDIADIQSKVHHMNLIDFAEGICAPV